MSLVGKSVFTMCDTNSNGACIHVELLFNIYSKEYVEPNVDCFVHSFNFTWPTMSMSTIKCLFVSKFGSFLFGLWDQKSKINSIISLLIKSLDYKNVIGVSRRKESAITTHEKYNQLFSTSGKHKGIKSVTFLHFSRLCYVKLDTSPPHIVDSYESKTKIWVYEDILRSYL